MFSESVESEAKSGGRAARALATRAALIEAVIALLAEGGVSLVTHRAVAAKAQVSPALVAYHFATLDDLLAATSRALNEGAAARLRAAIQAVSQQATLLDVTARHLAEQFGSYRHTFIARLELDLAMARRGTLPPETDRANSLFISLIRPFVADDRTARTLLAAIVGYALQAVLGLESTAEADCRHFLTQLYDRHGVRPDQAAIPFPETKHEI